MTAAALSENWATLWEAFATAEPNRVAVVLGDTEIRWGRLDDRAARLASALSAKGIGPGARVAQLLYNCPEYLESAYSAFKIRASTVNVNYRYRAPEIAHVLGDSGSSALVFHGAFADVVDEARRSLPELTTLVQVDGGDGRPLLDGAVDYETFLNEHEPMAPIVRSGDDRLMLYTGGTTGMPKGVVWTHRGLFGALAFTGYASLGLELPTTVQQATQIATELARAGTAPVNMTAPPLMHGTAMFLAFSTFVLGGRVVMLAGRRFDPAELLRLVEREKVSQLSIVGDAFARPILEELARTTYDVSSLRRIVSTGATFSAEHKRALMAAAPEAMILDMIGASEGGPFALAVTPPGQIPPETAEFFATPATAVFDPDTLERISNGSGRSGVLAVSGPMPDGYHGDDEKTARTFRTIEGVRYSMPGDFARIDADGRVHLLGRGSGCINTGGEKVYPEEVEVAARAHPGVEDCVAIGVPDERFGERVVLVAARGANHDAVTSQQVIDHVKSQVAAYKAPRQIVFVDAVYRSPSGKADYGWARRAFTEGTPSP
jgi:3-oxocholest-4-en-26-oate---CoA ligase